VTGLGPILASAGYAGLLWLIALALDAVGRRSLRPRHGRTEAVAIGSDVARFHRVLAGAVLATGAFVLAAHVIARHDWPALLLVPLVLACLGGAARRVAPLWREP
jgi:hypothetical protein